MHTKAHFHDQHYGMQWGPANVAITMLLTLLFLMLLFLVMTITATPADGQNTVPPTARQAATMPQFAARLAHAASSQMASRVPYSAQPRASYKRPWDARLRNNRGGPLQDNTLYENGPINGTTDAWTINFGFVVSNTLTVPSGGGSVNGLTFGAWVFPGDVLQTVEISISSQALGGGTIYSDQVVNFTVSGCSGNQYGYNVCTETSGNLTGPNLAAGTYWVNLQNAVVNTGDPIYWDENSGIGCTSQGCPSQAEDTGIGTIPSEAFTILGENTTTTTCNDQSSQYQREDGGFIHTFTSDEGSPAAGLAIDQHENLFGATVSGGTNNDGLSYKLSQAGQDWIFTPLYNFLGGLGGQNSSPEIIAPDETLYGTADGGLQTCGSSGNQYCGIVYRLRPPPVICLNALCGWGQEVLYRFTGDPDGWAPDGPLTLDPSGNLYGTTLYGGAYGQGTVFELTPSGGGWTEKIIYNFTGGSDGGGPTSLLSGPNGYLYGTTYAGGGGGGIIFQLAPSGSGWAQTILSSFNGCYPGGGACGPVLTQEHHGSFYGLYLYNTQLCNYGQCYDWTLGRAFMFSPDVPTFNRILGDTYDLYCLGFGCLGPYGYAVFHGITVNSAGQVYATSGYGQGCYSLGQLNALPSGQVLGQGDSDVWRDVEAGPSGNLYGTFGACCGNSGAIWQISP